MLGRFTNNIQDYIIDYKFSSSSQHRTVYCDCWLLKKLNNSQTCFPKSCTSLKQQAINQTNKRPGLNTSSRPDDFGVITIIVAVITAVISETFWTNDDVTDYWWRSGLMMTSRTADGVLDCWWRHGLLMAFWNDDDVTYCWWRSGLLIEVLATILLVH